VVDEGVVDEGVVDEGVVDEDVVCKPRLYLYHSRAAAWSCTGHLLRHRTHWCTAYDREKRLEFSGKDVCFVVAWACWRRDLET
jgi:hypothetical protein